MKCSTDELQAFLDGELGPAEVKAVRRHLGGCPACRRELSRLRLLWLELEQDGAIEIPVELPFLRQQAITRARNAVEKRGGTTGIGLWDAQKIAWQPVLAGVSQIPGPRQLGRLARVTAELGLPAVIRGVSSVAGMIAGKRRDRR